jgi:5-methylcytosine-specific restriction endonuclease McrA
MSRSRSEDLRVRAQKLENSAYHDFWTSVVECSEILKEIHPTKRPPLQPIDVIKDLYNDQKGLCPLCGDPLGDSLASATYHVDHNIPFSRGGGNERTNLRLLCPPCNLSKGAKVDPYDLLRYLEDRYMNT